MRRVARALVVAGLLAAGPASYAQRATEEAQHGESGAAARRQHLTPWKWANFFVLITGLGYLVYRNAGPFFRSRTQQILGGIAEAERLREQAEARMAEVNRRLANFEAEAESLRKAAQEESAAERARISRELEREFAKIHAQAEQEIAAATKAARLELKAYAAELALSLAREKIQQRLTAADENALVEEFVRELSPEPVGAGAIQ